MPFEIAETTAKDNKIAVLEDRVAELEELLGIDDATIDPFRKLGLPPLARKMLGLIMKRERASTASLFLAAYGGLNECDQPEDEDSAVRVRIWNIRNALDPLGIKVSVVYREGWSISAADKAKLWLLLEQLPEGHVSTARKKISPDFRRNMEATNGY